MYKHWVHYNLCISFQYVYHFYMFVCECSIWVQFSTGAGREIYVNVALSLVRATTVAVEMQ